MCPGEIDTITLAGDALKIDYRTEVVENINVSHPAAVLIEQTTKHIIGNQIVFALGYGRSGGTGVIDETGDFPDPYPAQTKQAILPTINIAGRMWLSDKALKATRKAGAAAFYNLLERDLSNLQRDTKDLLARMYQGSPNGKITTITAVGAYGTGVQALTIDAPFKLYEGQSVDILDATPNPDAVIANGSDWRVLRVNTKTGVIHLQTTGTDINANIAANADYIVLHGNLGKEMNGMDVVFTEGNTMYGLDKLLFPWFDPTVIDLAVGGAMGEIDELVLQQAEDDVDRRTGETLDAYLTTWGVRRAFFAYMSSMKMNTTPMKLRGGFEALDWKGKPFVVERYNPANTIRCLSTKTWALNQMDDWDWMGGEGGGTLTKVANKPVWEASLIKYCDLSCDKPAANVEIRSVAEH